ncbi:unnamed protein product [Rhizophagus irregularis]|nr:unnamed protein product [Rhizophagus irregularis]
MFQDTPNELNNNEKIKILNFDISHESVTSKIHQFEGLPEPKNATEEEQEAFHSKPYDFSIPQNIEDWNRSESSDESNNSTSKIILQYV